MSEQLNELEFRLTHLEAAIDELTETVLRQQQTLTATAEQLKFIKSLLGELSPAAVRALADEVPPPHY
ncbi:MAG: SlyX family protein [Thiohalomonadaceae bacterium]